VLCIIVLSLERNYSVIDAHGCHPKVTRGSNAALHHANANWEFGGPEARDGWFVQSPKHLALAVQDF